MVISHHGRGCFDFTKFIGVDLHHGIKSTQRTIGHQRAFPGHVVQFLHLFDAGLFCMQIVHEPLAVFVEIILVRRRCNILATITRNINILAIHLRCTALLLCPRKNLKILHTTKIFLTGNIDIRLFVQFLLKSLIPLFQLII